MNGMIVGPIAALVIIMCTGCTTSRFGSDLTGDGSSRVDKFEFGAPNKEQVYKKNNLLLGITKFRVRDNPVELMGSGVVFTSPHEVIGENGPWNNIEWLWFEDSKGKVLSTSKANKKKYWRSFGDEPEGSPTRSWWIRIYNVNRIFGVGKHKIFLYAKISDHIPIEQGSSADWFVWIPDNHQGCLFDDYLRLTHRVGQSIEDPKDLVVLTISKVSKKKESE